MPNEKEKEFTESGTPIFRYEEKEFEFKAPEEIDLESKEKFEEHIENYLGPISGVYHEILSHLVHIDVYHIEPSKDKPYHSLITHGMSDQPMDVPEGCEEWTYAELVCFLPKEWDLSEEGIKDQKYYWVIENMKFLARLPHEYSTWLGYGHTIVNSHFISSKRQRIFSIFSRLNTILSWINMLNFLHIVRGEFFYGHFS